MFQVDVSILITANVPSAKKIVVHGPQVCIVLSVSKFTANLYCICLSIPPIYTPHVANAPIKEISTFSSTPSQISFGTLIT